MTRLFVAIDLPDDIRHNLASICFGVPGASWVDKTQIHLTMRFIGEVDGRQAEEITMALAQIKVKRFELSIKGIGGFPPRKPPTRILWAGIKKSDELLHLYKKVESALVRVGLPPEKRKFFPHITIARLKNSPTNRVIRYMQEHELLRTTSFLVDEFHLFSSILGSSGATHIKKASYTLL